MRGIKEKATHHNLNDLRFSARRMSQSATMQTARAYEGYRERYIKEWDRRRYRLPRLLESWLGRFPSGSALLDLGCGVGQDSRYLRRRRHQVVGVDLTWSFLTLARKRSLRLPLIQADLHELPFQNQIFDGVWAAASLIHCRKSRFRKALRQVRCLVKPGGFLGATLRYGARSGYLRNQWIPGRYISQWRKLEMQRAVQEAGWAIVQVDIVRNQERKGRWLNVIARRNS